MSGRTLMRREDRRCPVCGAHDARAERSGDDWHVVCEECGYTAQGFSTSAGAWELWNGEADGGSMLPGLGYERAGRWAS